MTLSEAPGSERVGSGECTTCCARFEVQSAPIRTVYSHKNPNYTWIAAQLKEKLNNIWILLSELTLNNGNSKINLIHFSHYWNELWPTLATSTLQSPASKGWNITQYASLLTAYSLTSVFTAWPRDRRQSERISLKGAGDRLRVYCGDSEMRVRTPSASQDGHRRVVFRKNLFLCNELWSRALPLRPDSKCISFRG